MELLDFLKANWVNLGLILVGLSAVWIYKMQEKGKLRDAACMIVLQINENLSQILKGFIVIFLHFLII